MNRIEFFLQAALACNLEKDESPAKEFYIKFPKTIEKHVQSIKKGLADLKKDVYDYVTTKVGNCTGIIDFFEKDYVDCYNLVISSITAGIYKCKDEEKCSFDSTTNKNLLIRNIKETLEKVLKTGIGTRLQETCNQDTSECKTALEDFKRGDFTSKGFEDQKSALAILVKTLVDLVQSVYKNLEKNPECEGQIIEKCLGINCIFSSGPFSITIVLRYESWHMHFVFLLAHIDPDNCKPNPCQNGGTCIDELFDFRCKCTEEWGGPDCSIGKKQQDILNKMLSYFILNEKVYFIF